MTTTAVGRQGEQLATEYLQSQGYQIITRNYRIPGGEVDIIARDGRVLCFVEVRARADREHGDPLETITPQKIARISRAAWDYVEALPRPWPAQMRFDALGIVFGDPPEIELVRGAFETP